MVAGSRTRGLRLPRSGLPVRIVKSIEFIMALAVTGWKIRIEELVFLRANLKAKVFVVVVRGSEQS